MSKNCTLCIGHKIVVAFPRGTMVNAQQSRQGFSSGNAGSFARLLSAPPAGAQIAKVSERQDGSFRKCRTARDR